MDKPTGKYINYLSIYLSIVQEMREGWMSPLVNTSPIYPSIYLSIVQEMREGWMSPLGNNKDLTINLWQLSEELTGVRFNQTY